MGVVPFNHSDVNFPIKQGDRVAQLILKKIAIPTVQEVQELGETERGTGGFGSTGVQSSSQQGEGRQINISMTVNSQDPDQAVQVQMNIHQAQKPFKG